jgi:hypothetical protein
MKIGSEKKMHLESPGSLKFSQTEEKKFEEDKNNTEEENPNAIENSKTQEMP